MSCTPACPEFPSLALDCTFSVSFVLNDEVNIKIRLTITIKYNSLVFAELVKIDGDIAVENLGVSTVFAETYGGERFTLPDDRMTASDSTASYTTYTQAKSDPDMKHGPPWDVLSRGGPCFLYCKSLYPVS